MEQLQKTNTENTPVSISTTKRQLPHVHDILEIKNEYDGVERHERLFKRIKVQTTQYEKPKPIEKPYRLNFEKTKRKLLHSIGFHNKDFLNRYLKHAVFLKNDKYQNCITSALHECIKIRNIEIGIELTEIVLNFFDKQRMSGELYTPQYKIAMGDGFVTTDFGILNQAVYFNTIGIVELLLKAGFDPNYTTSSGSVCIMLAAAKNNVEMIRLLVKYNANIEKTMQNGVNALSVACFNGHTETVIELLNMGAEVDCRTMDGTTPLMSTIQGGHMDIVQLLVSRGANINATKNNGSSPVIVAARYKKPEFIKYLGSLGADVDLTLVNGSTALILSAAKGDFESANALCDLEADYRLRQNTGATALQYAAHRGHQNIMARIIQSGGVDIVNKDLHQLKVIATSKNHEHILSWLKVFKENRGSFDNLAFALSMNLQEKCLSILQSYTIPVNELKWMKEIPTDSGSKKYLDRALCPWSLNNSDVWPVSFNLACRPLFDRVKYSTLDRNILLYIVSFCDRNWFKKQPRRSERLKKKRYTLNI